jgi:hypothetical protein
LLGVLLATSGLVGSLRLHAGAQIFTVALIFGLAQYLFTRLTTGKPKTFSTPPAPSAIAP